MEHFHQASVKYNVDQKIFLEIRLSVSGYSITLKASVSFEKVGMALR